MRIVVLLLAAVLSVPLFAADPNHKRGFSPNEVYQVGDVDHVNVFNGNVVINIPIGQAYRVGPSLQYQFALTYNSKIWDYELDDDVVVENCVRDALPCSLRFGVPESTSTAGFGWTLSLGRLVLPSTEAPFHGWIYIGPDGASHELTHIIAPSDPLTPPMAIVRARTADASYLELNRSVPASPEISFPDGHIRTFDAAGRLTGIRDRHGNWVSVAYEATRWVVTDGHGAQAARTHYVNLIDKSDVFTGDQPNFQSLVASVDLAAFDDTPANPNSGDERALYEFTYDDQWVGRGGGGDRPWDHNVEEGAQLCVTAPFLQHVALPDGTSYEPSYKVLAPASASKPAVCTPQPGDDYSVLAPDWGIIQALGLPTGGSIEWVHGLYPMNLAYCRNGTGFAANYVGVRSRIFRNRDGDELMKWTYTPALSPAPQVRQTCEGQDGTIPGPAEQFTNDVEISSGPALGGTKLRTRNYFSVFPEGGLVINGKSGNGFKPGDYGRPFTRFNALGSELTGNLRLLSSEVYDCTLACGSALQRRYVLYEQDPSPHFRNPRVSAERTVESSDTGCGDGGCYTDTQRSDWDGYGHYRKSVTTSNVPGTPIRTTFTGYTPDPAKWLLNLYGESWVQQGTGATASATKSRTVFDPDKGVILSSRALRASGPDPAALNDSSSDLFSISCRDGSPAGLRGFVTSERYFGGDNGSIQSDPCGVSHAAGRFFVNHSYTFSGSALATHQAQYAGTSHLIADEVFDRNTGTVRIARDSAGVETAFDYDASGRATSVRPAGRIATSYVYSPGSNPPSVAVSQECPSGAGASPCTESMLTDSLLYFDDLGRLTQEVHPFSETEWASTWTAYDGAGRKKSVSVPAQSSSGPASRPAGVPVTTWTYDVLGRPTLETRPDATTSAWTYQGSRVIKRFTGNALRSTETSNGLGQLVDVRQAPDGPSTDVTTSYQYDVGGRLQSVRMVAPGLAVQTRTFDYDGRGLLRWENQPESGMATYKYDARGHVTERDQSAANSQFDLRYAYDPAERLLTLSARNPLFGEPGEPQFRLMKEFTYGTGNTPAAGATPADLRKGKLVTAARYNYPTPAGFAVDENTYKIQDAYFYRDAAGRKTHRTTTISKLFGGDPYVVKSIDMGVTYNALDLPQKIQYPMCLDCGAPNAGPDRSGMIYGYLQGRLRSITGFVTDVTYWPNGMRKLLDHSNGIRDKQTVEAMPRPSRIAFGEVPVARCQRPWFTSQPANTTVAAGGGSATLSVVPGGTAPFEYEWVRVSDLEVVGFTQSITVSVTTSDELYVVVRNACGFEESHRAKVTVGGCGAPVIRSIAQVRQPDGKWELRPDVMAGPQRTFVWKRLSDNVQIGTTERVVVPAPGGTPVTYRLTLADSCGSVQSETTLTPAPTITTTGLVATATGPSQVTVTWPAVSDVSYGLERRSGLVWEEIASQLQSPSYVDDVSANRSYAYRAYAVRSNLKSDYTNSDVATTRSFVAATAGLPLTVTPFHEMLAAVNSVRAAAGWGAVSWTNILAASDPLPQPSARVVERHVAAARWRMNEALSALGVPLQGYTNGVLTGVAIRAVHVNEVQQRAR